MCGDSGGDGGAAQRKQTEDDRQSEAIARLNQSFGYGTKKQAPARSDFMRTQTAASQGGWERHGDDWSQPAQSQTAVYEDVFDEEGYNAAKAASDASGADLAGLAERKALYGKFAGDARALQLEDLNKERDVASRDVSFDLARRGLSGGSRDVDAGRQIDDAFQKGVLTSENNAQGIANTAEQNDEKTRVNLIQGIRGGMNEADAISSALNGMGNNAAQAANDARSQNIGGFFDVIRNQAQSQADASAYQKAFDKYRTGGSGPTGSNGTVNTVN